MKLVHHIRDLLGGVYSHRLVWSHGDSTIEGAWCARGEVAGVTCPNTGREYLVGSIVDFDLVYLVEDRAKVRYESDDHVERSPGDPHFFWDDDGVAALLVLVLRKGGPT